MTTTPNLALTQYATTDTINWVDEYNKDMLNIDTAVATKANQTSLDVTNAIVAQKADKSEVTNVMTPKGNLSYASLPTTGNTVGWYYYCPDGDGTHGAGNYVWNGTSWYFGGTGDEGYSILKNDLVDIQNDMYSKKITQISNAPTNYAYEFVKGKEYKINIKSTDATTVQVGTIVNIGDSSYVNSTPVLSGTPINYDFIFRATGNAHYLYRYKVSSSATVDITIEELGDLALATKDEVSAVKNEIINNSCSIYEFLGTKDSILSADSWSQGNGYISLSHNGDNFSDGAVAQKYVTAFDRVISYDFVPYANSIVCGYTQSAGYEYFWKQGYCISVNFSNKTLNIHNKYGVDSNAVSTTLPSVNKSVAFTQDVYAGRKFRLVIERTEDRGLKATLCSLLDYSVLATISIEFEALTIPTVGLGYDYPSFTVLSGTADLYYLGIKIKYATNCHLYIVGDSLTEGVAIEPSKAWAYMVAKSCQNTVVSGRGGATINSMLKRIEDEANALKPKYVMVMIGTNSGNTPEKLQALVTAIIGIGAIPIINCIPCTSTSVQSSVNADILALNTYHVRMDIATALNYDLVNGSDTSLFLADGVHINATGYERMYKRVLIDCPFLFN